ncbi:MAG TPA: ABC transporter permease [Candidatus Thermoplasmatota archaeon]|nr:ABC transporter permease [Candidatus Thermoplasmatota archaeon]
MTLRRTLAFTKRSLLQFRHDRRTFAFIIVMPLLMILIFGYTFGGDVQGVKVALINQDKGIQSILLPGNPMPPGLFLAENITASLDPITLSLHNFTDPAEARHQVDDGTLWAAIIFPDNFSENFFTSLSHPEYAIHPSIEVYLDGSNPTIASTVLRTLSEAIQETMKTVARWLNISQTNASLVVEPVYAYGGGSTRFIDYFAPGVISFAIMMVTTMITIILFVNERRTGTLQRLLVSPAKEHEIVLGYSLAFATIGLLQSIVVLSAALLIFNISIVGSLPLALLVVMLIGVGHQGLGILLSAGARNEMQAIQFVPLILFPSILLAGLFWPIESIPSYLQPLCYIIPLRYGIDAERSIMLRGWGVGQVWMDIVVLLVFAMLTITGSIFLLKRKK